MERKHVAGSLRGVVGVGAATGGLAACLELVAVLRNEALAYVVFLAGDVDADVVAKLSDAARLPVVLIDGEAHLEPAMIYVAPRGRVVRLEANRLASFEPTTPAERRHPLDEFCRSLAERAGTACASVILSGLGTDGTVGSQLVKEAGGLTIVQAPETTSDDGAVLSAMSTGLIDRVSTIDQIADALDDFAESLPLWDRRVETAEVEDLLDAVCKALDHHVSHDFSNYKRTTLARRVQRRLSARRLESVAEYVEVLRDEEEEAQALFRELLIGVTAFFRDRDVFDRLGAQLEKRLSEVESEFRVWVPGCATGQEAYTLAMLIQEALTRLRRDDVEVKVFATDIDYASLDVARKARYPLAVLDQVGPARAERHFQRVGEGLQVRKSIRDCVIFSEHNLISDPPFSRMDLVSCRNVLIYLDATLHQRVLPMLHYSLRPGGLLVLGPAESIGAFQRHFEEIDGKRRFFEAKRLSERLAPSMPYRLEPRRRRQEIVPPPALQRTSGDDLTLLQLRRIVEAYGPTSLLVDESGRIVNACGVLDAYFELKSWGPPESNAIQLAREDLRPDLRAAFHEAKRTCSPTRVEGVLVHCGEDESRWVTIVVEPFRPDTQHAEEQYLIVLIDERDPPDRHHGEPLPRASRDPAVAQLEAELEATKRSLQRTVEELETSNEELMSSNEELLSMNEELQSSNEELQTSQEELQSVNEELETVNAELQYKIAELGRARDDLRNFFETTEFPTLFLDRQLRIKHFTPTCEEVFRIIESDLERSIRDLMPRYRGEDVIDAAEEVLKSARPTELTVVREEDGERRCYFLVRIIPYRTEANAIDGVVIAFVDVTELEETAGELRRSELRARRHAAELRSIYHNVQAGLALVDANLRFVSANRRLAEMDGLPIEDHPGRTFGDVWPNVGAQVHELVTKVRDTKREIAGARLQHTSDDGVQHWLINLAPILDADGNLECISVMIENATEAISYQRELEKTTQMLDIALSASDSGVWDWQDGEHFWSPQYRDLFGIPLDETPNFDALDAILPEEERTRIEVIRQGIMNDPSQNAWKMEYQINHPERGRRWLQARGRLERDEEGTVRRMTGITVDITERRLMEDELRRSNLHKDEFLAMLGHELRNPLAAIRHVVDLLVAREERDEQLVRLAAVLRRQTHHMTRLLDELLDVSRVASGKLNVERKPTDLARVASDVVADMKRQFSNHDIELSYAGSPEPVVVKGDETRLAQALSNLLDNALKFTPAGGSVEVSVSRSGTVGVVKVRDTGIGVEPSLLERLFEPFQQGPQDLDRELGGLGLGLSLVKGIVALHDGTVTAHSEGDGTGSEFVITLPMTEEPVETELREPQSEPGPTLDVLIIEDNEDAATLLREILETMGHSARVAHEGEAGLKLAREEAPRVAICDIGLPRMSGYQLAKAFRDDPVLRDVKLVALTGYGRSADFEKSLRAGFDRHLTKPVDIHRLEEVLRELIG